MVKHIVLYTLKEGVDKDNAVEIIRSVLEPLVGVIPGLKHLEIRKAYQGGMDYALYSEFESAEALKNYAQHPAHLEAKTHFWEFLDKRYCADYEL
ncbi:MAG: Dabb family protein [Oscillospiraceae bacterium]|nr:Dabb family protein [Oscillospiraceae bacterium]